MVKIVDNTLRDGEQSPGVVFNKKEKLTLAYLLADSGIKHIEVGCPAICEEERNTLKLLAESNIPATLYTWNRAVKREVDLSFQCGIKNVVISMPVSDQMIDWKLKKSRERVLRHFADVIEYAVSRGAEVVCGFEDASRADLSFLKKLTQVVVNEGVSRIRLSDTLGVLTPDQTGKLVSAVKEFSPVPLEFHGHNNFGLANANSISAFLAGAEYIDASILGIGDGGGITALEEFVSTVEYLLKIKTGISMTGLKSLSDFLLIALGLELWPWKPVLGKNNYTHESGVHVDGILKDSKNYEIVSPEVYGIRRKIVLGKHSGNHAVEYYCKTLGLDTSLVNIHNLTSAIKEKSIIKKDILSVEEIKEIYFSFIEEKNSYQKESVNY
jgi:homocitrate synthase NifV